MMTAAEAAEAAKGLTFETVWAALMETRSQIEATDIRLSDKVDKLSDKIDRMADNVGGLNRKFGELAEYLVAPGIVRCLNDWGRYQFNAYISRGAKIQDPKGKVKAEIDVLVSSPEVLVAVEVKIEPSEKHIAHHSKRLEILREFNNTIQDRRKIFGAVAGAIFPQDVKEQVLEAGMLVIEQSGDTMKLSVPEDFQPAEW